MDNVARDLMSRHSHCAAMVPFAVLLVTLLTLADLVTLGSGQTAPPAHPLGRLIGSTLSVQLRSVDDPLVSGTNTPAAGGLLTNPYSRTDQWQLDLNDNITRRQSNQALNSYGDTVFKFELAHNNQLRAMKLGPQPGTTVQQNVSRAAGSFVYDAAGNLTCDGEHFYGYDAQNRLIGVDQAVMELAPGSTTANPTYVFAPGAWLKRYIYDGLGRLIRTESPFLGAGGKITREETFFLRRLASHRRTRYRSGRCPIRLLQVWD